MSQYDPDGFSDFRFFEEMDPLQQAAFEASLEDFEYDRSEDYCSHCGKEYTEFSDLGCEFCDVRVLGGGV